MGTSGLCLVPPQLFFLSLPSQELFPWLFGIPTISGFAWRGQSLRNWDHLVEQTPGRRPWEQPGSAFCCHCFSGAGFQQEKFSFVKNVVKLAWK